MNSAPNRERIVISGCACCSGVARTVRGEAVTKDKIVRRGGKRFYCHGSTRTDKPKGQHAYRRGLA